MAVAAVVLETLARHHDPPTALASPSAAAACVAEHVRGPEADEGGGKRSREDSAEMTAAASTFGSLGSFRWLAL